MLRLPLKRVFYDEFLLGTKTTEFRRYGPLFNETRFFQGRDVVLTPRYNNKGPFLATKVAGVEREPAHAHPDMIEIYPMLEPDDPIALIRLIIGREISLAEEQELRNAFKERFKRR